MYEVELKFPLVDFRVVERLQALGARFHEGMEHWDVYFQHPARDFGQTDEALRIRSLGDSNRITYKGPVTDSRTKTRREIEVPFAAGAQAAEQLSDILLALGFQPVRQVRKFRMVYRLVWQDRDLEIAADRVFDLGPYLEIETLAEESDKAGAQEAILDLASRLDLPPAERRSYLCLLLERDRDRSIGGKRDLRFPFPAGSERNQENS